jgi:hypothetical protein
MFSALRSYASIALLCIGSAVFAQTVYVGTAGEKLRFTSEGNVCEIRVQIVAGGGTVFDSEWRDGSVVDCPIDPATAGLSGYRAIVFVKDIEGRVTQKESTLALREGTLLMGA